MIVEKNSDNKFSASFSGYKIIGFHATSSMSSCEIEKIGFLPNKIFDDGDHQTILSRAQFLGINTADYQQWLQMKSVTFVDNVAGALAHIQQGSAGGQGLKNMVTVLQHVVSKGTSNDLEMANNFLSRIDAIRNAGSVIYAVDLSNIGQRLVQDKRQSTLKHIYFDPSAPLPAESIVGPLNLIARLDVI